MPARTSLCLRHSLFHISKRNPPPMEQDYIVSREQENLTKLKGIVQQAMDEERLLTERLMQQPTEQTSAGQRIADQVAKFGGSWAFIGSFGFVLAVWIAFNAWVAPVNRFDPFPFILLNLVLSCIAAIQAPVIMMSQNRQEEKDRARNVNDYMINLKAEMEIRNLHEKIDLLMEGELRTLYESQAAQMQLLQAICNRLEIPRDLLPADKPMK